MNQPLLDTIIGIAFGIALSILAVMLYRHFTTDTKHVEIIEYECINEVCTMDVHGATVIVHQDGLKKYKRQLRDECALAGHYVVIKNSNGINL